MPLAVLFAVPYAVNATSMPHSTVWDDIENVGLHPTELRVSSPVYDSFLRLRHRELTDGNPLGQATTLSVRPLSPNRSWRRSASAPP
ncbi:hypothetical protein [Streptomyces sp. NPDC056660]|uniref:hypothetical protein n=1 Tax=Streptomyces sp. NPDC056660 TaxID=3345897 RepID=UPI00367EF469